MKKWKMLMVASVLTLGLAGRIQLQLLLLKLQRTKKVN